MSRRLLTGLLLVIALLTTGCIGSRETDDIAYVIAVGVDKSDEKMMEVTYQIALPREQGGGGKEGGEAASSFILNTIKATNLAEARNLLTSTMGRFPSLTHTKAFIISEEFARQGLGSFIGPLLRFREFRGSIILVIVKGTAKDFMHANNPKIDTQMSKYYEGLLFEKRESGFFLQTDVHDFYIRLKNPVGSPYALYAGLNPKGGINAPAGPKVPPEKTDEYIPGGIPRSGDENRPEFLGTALFRADKMVGWLSNEETRVMEILQGDFTRGYLVIEDPLEPKASINISLRMGEQPDIKLRMNDGKVSILVKLRLEGEITSIPSGINYEVDEYRQLLEAQITTLMEHQIRKMLRKTQELGTDPFGFTAYMRPEFKTDDELMKADLLELYSQADIQLDIKSAIRRSGLMWRSTEIFGKDK
ncbi:MAG: gerBC 1 [Sporomusa sp.]|nr:gerBC 1 [Sporomusa sp.]